MTNKKLHLDMGHALVTPGKETNDNPPVKEFTLNKAVADKVIDLLAGYNVTITTTGIPNTDTPLSTRVSTINTINPDLMVSIHHNAGGGTGT